MNNLSTLSLALLRQLPHMALGGEQGVILCPVHRNSCSLVPLARKPVKLSCSHLLAFSLLPSRIFASNSL